MTSTLFKLSLASVLLCACQSGAYRINGFARQQQEGDTISLILENQAERQLGQAIVCDGLFCVTGTIDTTLMCRAYLKRIPDCGATFFLEPGNITLEINLPPKPSRVSGTKLNNIWQQMNDSVQLIGSQLITLAKDIRQTDAENHFPRLKAIDSLHRKMSACVLNTARKNKDNPLGHFINEYYKEPEFK